MKKYIFLSILMFSFINNSYGAGVPGIYSHKPLHFEPLSFTLGPDDGLMSLLFMVMLGLGFCISLLIARRFMAIKPKQYLIDGILFGFSIGAMISIDQYFHTFIPFALQMVHCVIGFLIGVVTAPQRKINQFGKWLWHNNMLYALMHE